MIKARSQKIEEIRKKFRNRREWLLIAVDEIDQATTTVVRGHLIAHSPHYEDIARKSISYRGDALIDFSEDRLPKDTAIILRANHTDA